MCWTNNTFIGAKPVKPFRGNYLVLGPEACDWSRECQTTASLMASQLIGQLIINILMMAEGESFQGSKLKAYIIVICFHYHHSCITVQMISFFFFFLTFLEISIIEFPEIEKSIKMHKYNIRTLNVTIWVSCPGFLIRASEWLYY